MTSLRVSPPNCRIFKYSSAGTIEIGSAALVPLSREVGIGVLAIGSPDEQRFHPTMSTDFLARIGDLVSEAVAAA